MSQAGNVWDNAAMESFFSSRPYERHGSFIEREMKLRPDVFYYINRFYNPKRRHSTNG
jgi:putative transposase